MGLNSNITKADENIGDKQQNKYFKIRWNRARNKNKGK